MADETYNGWANYATWRINLEVVDDLVHYSFEEFKDGYTGKPERYALGRDIKDLVEDVLFDQDPGEVANDLVVGYAQAFIDEVNWDEIAGNILSDWDES